MDHDSKSCYKKARKSSRQRGKCFWVRESLFSNTDAVRSRRAQRVLSALLRFPRGLRVVWKGTTQKDYARVG